MLGVLSSSCFVKCQEHIQWGQEHTEGTGTYRGGAIQTFIISTIIIMAIAAIVKTAWQ